MTEYTNMLKHSLLGHSDGQLFKQGILCKLGIHRYREVASGYPKGYTVWMDIRLCQCCGKRVRVIDDLFTDERNSQSHNDMLLQYWKNGKPDGVIHSERLESKYPDLVPLMNALWS